MVKGIDLAIVGDVMAPLLCFLPAWWRLQWRSATEVCLASVMHDIRLWIFKFTWSLRTQWWVSPLPC